LFCFHCVCLQVGGREAVCSARYYNNGGCGITSGGGFSKYYSGMNINKQNELKMSENNFQKLIS
jgi:hypothetical protein